MGTDIEKEFDNNDADQTDWSATDLCGVTVTPTESKEELCLNGYTITRSWAAVDAFGNTAEEFQTVTVTDTTPPVFYNSGVAITSGELPSETKEWSEAEVNLQLGLPLDFITARDPVSDTIVTVSASSTNTQVNSVGDNCDDGYHTFIIERSWFTKDDCNNEAELKQTVFFEDTTPPVFTNEPKDETLECDAQPDSKCVVQAVECLDSGCCDVGSVQFSSYRNSSAGDTNYVIYQEWSATDSAGNPVLHQSTVIVKDTTPPVFTRLPADETISCDCESQVATTLQAMDNCDENSIEVAYSESRIDLSNDNNYLKVRTWKAQDSTGNDVTHVQTVTVKDSDAPQLYNIPDDALEMECGAYESYIAPDVFARDSCDSNDLVVTSSTISTDSPGTGVAECFFKTYTTTYASKDQSENPVQKDLVIKVKPNTVPAKNVSICVKDAANKEIIFASNLGFKNIVGARSCAVAGSDDPSVSFGHDHHDNPGVRLILGHDGQAHQSLSMTFTDECAHEITRTIDLYLGEPSEGEECEVRTCAELGCTAHNSISTD